MTPEAVIYRSQILGADRAMLGESHFVTIHVIGRIPVKIPLDRIIWTITPGDRIIEDLKITMEISLSDFQPIYHINGSYTEVIRLADSFNITTDLFDKIRSIGTE